MKKPKAKVEPPVEIRKKVEFAFARIDDMERVVVSLARSGYYVRCSQGSSGYIIHVYTDREI